jgi:hypothetical protein
MKYSIIIPYCNRKSLASTFLSYTYHYEGRDDYEVIIILDIIHTNRDDYETFKQIIKKYENRIKMTIISDNYESYNTAKKYNIGYTKASGEYIILSHPEIFHADNILAGLDESFINNNECYIICSCRSALFPQQIINQFEEYRNGKLNVWYQHGKYNNKKLNYCSALSKVNYLKTGGFDERYCGGIAFEGDNFIKRIEKNKIPVILHDDLLTLHIEHNRKYMYLNHKLYNENKKLFQKHCKNNDFMEKFV